VVCDLVAARLLEADCSTRGVLLDGFPRTQQQASMLLTKGLTFERFLLLDVPDKIVIGKCPHLLQVKRAAYRSTLLTTLLTHPPTNHAASGIPQTQRGMSALFVRLTVFRG
jgi:adenylate kinase family enzyme